MKFLLIILLLIIASCSYPDIDTVPKFDNLEFSEQEAIDLCKLSNNNRIKLMECLVDYYENN
tara:strand:+ start:246 stop:431 length:186 start_codon:yes stop_codon:yes gene_type:complete